MPALPHPQGRSGLIERDEPQTTRIRTPDQSMGYSQGLALPPGEGGGPRPRGGKDDPQVPEQLGGLPVHPAAVHEKTERQGLRSQKDVRRRVKPLDQPQVLIHRRDPPVEGPLRGHPLQALPSDLKHSAVGLDDAGKAFQQRRFPRSVVPHKSDDFSRKKVERDVPQRLHAAVTFAQAPYPHERTVRTLHGPSAATPQRGDISKARAPHAVS